MWDEKNPKKSYPPVLQGVAHKITLRDWQLVIQSEVIGDKACFFELSWDGLWGSGDICMTIPLFFLVGVRAIETKNRWLWEGDRM